MIYLDYAAAAPVRPEVVKAMQAYLTDQFYNPASLYQPARAVRRTIDDARSTVAKVLGAKASEIIFTAGATESINLAVQGVAKAFPGQHIATSAIEHESVLATVNALGKQGWMQTSVIPVTADGFVRIEDVAQAITDQTVLISVIYANHEIGTVQPLAKIGQLIAGIRTDRAKRGISLPLYLHSDASQAAGYLDLQVQRLGVDLLTLNGAKLGGPKQSGVLYVKTGTRLEPLIYGGGQEGGTRAGTENAAAAVGLAKALEIATRERVEETKRLAGLRDQLIKALAQIPRAKLNGHISKRLPNNVNFTFYDATGETLVLYLEQAGILAGTGAACSIGSDQPSASLIAIGLSPTAANSSLRLTLGYQTTAADIRQVIKVFPALVARVRQVGS